MQKNLYFLPYSSKQQQIAQIHRTLLYIIYNYNGKKIPCKAGILHGKTRPYIRL